jgi:hypothetical protein
MNPRERFLALGVLLVVVLAGTAFLFHQLFWQPLQDRDANIQALEREIEKKQDRIMQVEADRPKFERWKQLSLPADMALAKREYEKYLSELMRECGFNAESTVTPPQQADSKTTPQIQGKGPVFTRLQFNVHAYANLGNLVQLLERFYRTGLLHRIKNFSIQRPLTPGGTGLQPDELDITMIIDALIVTGADKRSELQAGPSKRALVLDTIASLRNGPTGLGAILCVLGPTGPFGPGSLARPAGEYDVIAQKNIFLGPPERERRQPVEVTHFVHLTDITQNDKRTEARLYDRYNNKRTRLRAEPGFDSFRVMNEKGEPILRGKVMRIDARDVIFRVDKKDYSWHLGQSLEDVLKSPLTDERRRVLGFATSQDTAKKTD